MGFSPAPLSRGLLPVSAAQGPEGIARWPGVFENPAFRGRRFWREEGGRKRTGGERIASIQGTVACIPGEGVPGEHPSFYDGGDGSPVLIVVLSDVRMKEGLGECGFCPKGGSEFLPSGGKQYASAREKRFWENVIEDLGGPGKASLNQRRA